MQIAHKTLNSEKWTGHAEPIDRFMLFVVLLAGAAALAVVGYYVL